jgi:hypothetical protein
MEGIEIFQAKERSIMGARTSCARLGTIGKEDPLNRYLKNPTVGCINCRAVSSVLLGVEIIVPAKPKGSTKVKKMQVLGGRRTVLPVAGTTGQLPEKPKMLPAPFR